MIISGDRFFVITWKPGPNWVVGQPVTAQRLESHQAYFARLTAQGKVAFAGAFLDQAAGGIAVIRATSAADAQAMMNDDPAITDGVFEGVVRPFYVVFADAAESEVRHAGLPHAALMGQAE